MAERTEALDRARSHSRLVSLLKIGFPVAALGLLGLYFLSPSIEVSIGDMNASVQGVVIEKGNLRMVNPKLEGANEKQGNYVVTASYAEQAVANPDTIHLTELQAKTNNAQKDWSRLTSPKGIFETKTEKLELIGDIRVAQSNGMKARLTRANVDMKGQTVVSNEPVRVDFPAGRLEARTMQLDMDTKEASFNGDVRVRMEQEGKEPAKVEPEQTTKSFANALKSDQPVDISAPRLKIFDATKLAHFQGGVRTIQGGSHMQSKELKVYYANDPQQDTQDSSSAKLKLIDALGTVSINTADGRQANAERLVYDAILQKLTLNEDVVLTQAKNRLRGAQMISDLATGITRFPPGARVHGHFSPANEEKAQKPDADDPSRTRDVIQGAAQIDLSSTRGQPVDIEADSLTVNDKTSIAVFFGDVETVQGNMNMQSRKLTVDFSGEGKATSDAAQNGSEIKTIRAEGKVAIKTAEDQTTTSDWAEFDAASQTVTIGGNVVLSQGENVIKGSRLVIDLKTNRSRFVDGGGLPWKQQRVRGLFTPQNNGNQ
ncbi:MAG: LPS export ABC transporter periplasmic protein LptC [Hyphomicrobiaceae bacterium]|nr:LPS export ABC transporter periplasmic protein LptC [Hyphomicrobiaceae bacterium]